MRCRWYQNIDHKKHQKINHILPCCRFWFPVTVLTAGFKVEATAEAAEGITISRVETPEVWSLKKFLGAVSGSAVPGTEEGTVIAPIPGVAVIGAATDGLTGLEAVDPIWKIEWTYLLFRQPVFRWIGIYNSKRELSLNKFNKKLKTCRN